jgi:hypothetical protein
LVRRSKRVRRKRYSRYNLSPLYTTTEWLQLSPSKLVRDFVRKNGAGDFEILLRKIFQVENKPEASVKSKYYYEVLDTPPPQIKHVRESYTIWKYRGTNHTLRTMQALPVGASFLRFFWLNNKNNSMICILSSTNTGNLTFRLR